MVAPATAGESPDASKKSYRTKGKGVETGQLLRGNVRSITGYRSSSSIPSKFETTLHQGNKERNAFNCRVYRFNEHNNDLPGVGKYDFGGNLVNSSASMSKRGMGSLASKNFNTQGFTWGGIKAAVPGPGSYCPQSVLERTWHSGSSDKCLFAGRNGKSYLSSDFTPGPGDYQPKVEEKTVVSDCGAAFNSRAIRLKDKRAKGPAPGAYEVNKQPFNKTEYRNGLPSAAFTSGVERNKVAEELAAKNAAQPGPSSYINNEAHKLGLHGTGSHMFTGKITRAPFAFADQEVIQARLQAKYDGTPGPGSYFDPDSVKSKNPKAQKLKGTGAFKSNSARISYMEIKKTPGPSHYKAPGTGKPPKKSFHLNTTGSWV